MYFVPFPAEIDRDRSCDVPVSWRQDTIKGGIVNGKYKQPLVWIHWDDPEVRVTRYKVMSQQDPGRTSDLFGPSDWNNTAALRATYEGRCYFLSRPSRYAVYWLENRPIKKKDTLVAAKIINNEADADFLSSISYESLCITHTYFKCSNCL